MRFVHLIGLLASIVVIFTISTTIYSKNHSLNQNKKTPSINYTINEDTIFEDILNIEKIIDQSNNYDELNMPNVSFEKSKLGDLFYGTVFSFSKKYEKNEQGIVLSMKKNHALPEFKKQCISFFNQLEAFNHSENNKNYGLVIHSIEFPNVIYIYDHNQINTYCYMLEQAKPMYLTISKTSDLK